jgi:ribA/ribD-fused uncharacterized protein
MTINFFYPDKAYGEFSNFYPSSITIEGLTWRTTEHYFQAMKTEDAIVQEHIRQAASPGEAKRYGSHVKLRDDWDAVVGDARMWDIFRDPQGIVVERSKDHFMYQALIAKFTQNPHVMKLLLSTGEDPIVEDTRSLVGKVSRIDGYWGNGEDGNGLNKLGRMLVHLRSDTRRRAAQEIVAAPQKKG